MGAFAALDRRIATRFSIKPMGLAKSAAYLRHHLALAVRESPCSPTTRSPGCTASPPASPEPSTTPPPPPSSPPRPPARTSSTTPAPRKPSPSSPGTDHAGARPAVPPITPAVAAAYASSPARPEHRRAIAEFHTRRAADQQNRVDALLLEAIAAAARRWLGAC
jgi:hypothetical protein